MSSVAAAVLRGPLLYALRMKQEEKAIKAWAPFGNTDVNVTTPSQWRYALLLNASGAARSMRFERVHAGKGVAFNSSAVSLIIHAPAVELGAWRALNGLRRVKLGARGAPRSLRRSQFGSRGASNN